MNTTRTKAAERSNIPAPDGVPQMSGGREGSIVHVTDLQDGSVTLTYVVIVARYRSRLILCRHEDRTTWEVPGGHIEPGESPDDAADVS